jgi:hypothetical protein
MGSKDFQLPAFDESDDKENSPAVTNMTDDDL